MVRFCGTLKFKKKKLSDSKLSGSAPAKRERERERGGVMVPVKLFYR